MALPSWNWSEPNPVVADSTVIRAAHINEIRDAIDDTRQNVPDTGLEAHAASHAEGGGDPITGTLFLGDYSHFGIRGAFLSADPTYKAYLSNNAYNTVAGVTKYDEGTNDTILIIDESGAHISNTATLPTYPITLTPDGSIYAHSGQFDYMEVGTLYVSGQLIYDQSSVWDVLTCNKIIVGSPSHDSGIYVNHGDVVVKNNITAASLTASNVQTSSLTSSTLEVSEASIDKVTGDVTIEGNTTAGDITAANISASGQISAASIDTPTITSSSRITLENAALIKGSLQVTEDTYGVGSNATLFIPTGYEFSTAYSNNDGYAMIGNPIATNVVYDNRGIQARIGSANHTSVQPATLYLNPAGGNVSINSLQTTGDEDAPTLQHRGRINLYHTRSHATTTMTDTRLFSLPEGRTAPKTICEVSIGGGGYVHLTLTLIRRDGGHKQLNIAACEWAAEIRDSHTILSDSGDLYVSFYKEGQTLHIKAAHDTTPEQPTGGNTPGEYTLASIYAVGTIYSINWRNTELAPAWGEP